MEKKLDCDFLVSGADYAHTESLIDKKFRQYSDSYWNKKSLVSLFIVILYWNKKKIEKFKSPQPFFSTQSFEKHSNEIYSEPNWPKDPLFYVNLTSKTYKHTAPKGHENCFILIPIATNLNDSDKLRKIL